MPTLYQVDDRNLLTGLLSGEGGFHGPAVVLDGLRAEHALAKPNGLPPSIAEIVAHICYWQEWFNSCAISGFTGVPEHAAEVGRPFPPTTGTFSGNDTSPRSTKPRESWPHRIRCRSRCSRQACRFRSWPRSLVVREFCTQPSTAAIIWGRSSR